MNLVAVNGSATLTSVFLVTEDPTPTPTESTETPAATTPTESAPTETPTVSPTETPSEPACGSIESPCHVYVAPEAVTFAGLSAIMFVFLLAAILAAQLRGK